MKNKIAFLCIIALIIMLTACKSESANENNANNLVPTSGNSDHENQENNNHNDKKNNETKDQLDLVVGDTGKFDTSLGLYEITLNSVELLGPTVDDNETFADQFLLLNLTLKNTSNGLLSIDDIVQTLEVTENLESSGYGDVSYTFENYEFFEGDIASGDSKSGILIFNIYKSDEYYFRENPGTVGAGLTNQVIWTFKPEDAE